MSEIIIYNAEKKKVGSVEYPKEFDQKMSEGLLHQVVVAQQTNKREGNANVKSRHEVTGSTRKIVRQKGTGGARHGDIKAPIFVGGGRAFGPKSKNYEVRLPQKIRRGALRAAVTDRKNGGKLWIIDEINFKTPKTKLAQELFAKFEIPSALVVLDAGSEAAEKSIRNLRKFKVCRLDSLRVLDILQYAHLVMTKKSYEKFVA